MNFPFIYFIILTLECTNIRPKRPPLPPLYPFYFYFFLNLESAGEVVDLLGDLLHNVHLLLLKAFQDQVIFLPVLGLGNNYLTFKVGLYRADLVFLV